MGPRRKERKGRDLEKIRRLIQNKGERKEIEVDGEDGPKKERKEGKRLRKIRRLIRQEEREER